MSSTAAARSLPGPQRLVGAVGALLDLVIALNGGVPAVLDVAVASAASRFCGLNGRRRLLMAIDTIAPLVASSRVQSCLVIFLLPLLYHARFSVTWRASRRSRRCFRDYHDEEACVTMVTGWRAIGGALVTGRVRAVDGGVRDCCADDIRVVRSLCSLRLQQPLPVPSMICGKQWAQSTRR